MAGVGPLDLAAAVQAVALILDGQQVKVIGLNGRNTYPHESPSAAVTVSVHLDSAKDVDLVADLLDLGITRPASFVPDLHVHEAEWQGGVYVSLYGSPHRTAGRADAVSGKAAA